MEPFDHLRFRSASFLALGFPSGIFLLELSPGYSNEAAYGALREV
jgi:hypothetical protein